MVSIWDFIKNTSERYIITTDGDIFDIHTHDPIKIYVSKSGYISVSIRINGESKTNLLHRLVAQTFIPNPENKPQVNHIDAIKSHNFKNNLEWCTAKENMVHSSEHRLHPKTIACCLLDSKMDIIKVYLSINDASRDLGVHTKQIINCGRGISNDTKGYVVRYFDIKTETYTPTKFDSKDYKYSSSRKQKIICLETGEIFDSQCEASRVLGIRQPVISNNLNKGTKCKYNFKRI